MCHISKHLCGEEFKCFLSHIRRFLKFCVSYLQLTYKATADPHDLYYGLANTMLFSKRPVPPTTNCCVNKGIIQVVMTESHLKFCRVEKPVEYSFCANFQMSLRATCVKRKSSSARQEVNGRHYKSGHKNPWHFTKQNAMNRTLKANTVNNKTAGNFCYCSE